MRRGATQWIVFSSLICMGSLSAAWSSPVDLSFCGEEVGKPQVVVDTKGNATAVWYKSNGKDSTLQSSTMPFGEAWQTPVEVSQICSTDHSPQIAVDANSNVTIVWWKYKKTKGIIQASTMPFGGAWTIPDTLSRPVQDAENLQIAIDTEGNATAVWMEFNGKKWIIRSSAKPFGGTWQKTPDTLTFGGDNPQIAIDAHGHVTAVWQKYETDHNSIQASTKPYGGTWETPDSLSSPGQDAGAPQIIVGPSGYVTAIWRALDGNNRIIQSSSKPFGGTWQESPDSLSRPDQDAHYARIAIDTNGTITTVWNGFNGHNWTIQSSTKVFGGSWSTPETLSQVDQDADLPKIVVDAHGRATAIWRIYDGTDWIIQASTKPFGGSWTTADNLSRGGQAEEAQIAIDPLGNITVVWCKKEGSNYTIQASTNVLCPSATDLIDLSTDVSQSSLSSTTPTVSDSLEKTIEPSLSITPIIPDLPKSSERTPTFVGPCPPSPLKTTDPSSTENDLVPPMKMENPGLKAKVSPPSMKPLPIEPENKGLYQRPPSTIFIGRGKRTKKKLFLKTKWTKNTSTTIARYEIFARNKRIAKISAKKRAKATIRLHPHHVPHHLSKGYRIYLHNKYQIRAVDTFGTPISYTHIRVNH